MLPVTIGYGSESFSRSSMSLSSFILLPPFVKKLPGQARKDSTNARVTCYPASSRPDINGNLYLRTIDALEGDVFSLEVMRTISGRPGQSAGVCVQVRGGGPEVVVTAKMHNDPGRLNGEHFIVFNGRADVLTLEELQALRITPKNVWTDQYMHDDEEMRSALLLLETRVSGLPKPKKEIVVTSSGEKVSINSTIIKRKLRFR